MCLVLDFVTAMGLALFTGMFAMAGDSCAPDSPCMGQVGHGIAISLLGILAVLVIGLGCVIVAAISRTRLFIWALATLLLLPVPFAIGSNIANHASELSTVGPSHP
ncbi:hypothetical protein GFY24_17680 [Nocardia sp. SYP-A9097]|uniref:hypothetical protein n=1 Tax=Nocardia sp. SYP-A9097 TaxID=2663237 RepID=UPI00129A261C|nr:hypothetical protein [Nocardia sp. SYP-A9097]MRH89256.1 hypothetical protein [Nocardia sp. SYP-A9097]